ncbi:cell division protein ZapA [Salisediminibacterium beveridgei]|uniref:Cell division protein ZapA n=1 Tax=Salisediminibacterium beveridgei TaxID=632773 RepID=A0A1D7QTI5_9BACI|nr:cell division protein ZapA [Salisediminibacterium beveridgei]AOM82297.1 Cell division protein ZapA [Salisediminibacterium beveridgei]
MAGDRKNRTTVTIYGQNYRLVGEDDARHVEKVATMVDDKMRELRAANPYLDVSKLAVLTAVNMCHELVHLQDQIEDRKKDEDK